MIFSILIIIFFTVSLAFAVKISTSEDMVFESLGNYAVEQNEKGNRIWETLVLCPYCMASFYSLFGYLFYYLIFDITNWRIFFAAPVIIGASSLIHGLVWSVFELLWAKKAYYEKAEEKNHLEVKTMKQKHFESKNK
jgi:hypothetical protein